MDTGPRYWSGLPLFQRWEQEHAMIDSMEKGEEERGKGADQTKQTTITQQVFVLDTRNPVVPI